jgi:hypothetical protein
MRLTFDRLWILVALALPAFVSLVVPIPAVDLAYQVRAGDLILSTGSIPATDAFTFTVAGAPWTDQQWLAQALLALGFRTGGWELLAVLRAGLVVAAGALLVATARSRGASPRTASILSLTAFLLAAPALALRPQLFAIVVFAGLLALVAGRDRHPRAFLAAPLLVVLWANLHGSFVLAPVLLGSAWLDDLARHRPARRSLAVLMAGTLATLVNPFGIGVWAYAANIGANPVIAGRVSEWQRTTPLTVPGALFYASAIAAAVVAWRGRARLSWADALWLLAMAGLGAWAIRGLAWWPAGAIAVVAAALAPPLGAPVAERPRRRGSSLNGAVAVLLGLAIVVALPWWRPSDPLTGRRGLLTYAPSGLAAALRGAVTPGTRVFVPQTWGSWFEWAVPDGRYLVDARFELYPADVWSDVDAIESGGAADAEAALARRGVAVVVLDPSLAALGDRLVAAGWTPAFADADGRVLVRPAPSSRP